MKRIYIAHPYSGNAELNKKSVERIVKAVYAQGYLPVSPVHLFGWLGEDDSARLGIMKTCLKLVDVCDEVWAFGISKGVAEEIYHATLTDKPVKIMKVEGKEVRYALNPLDQFDSERLVQNEGI